MLCGFACRLIDVVPTQVPVGQIRQMRKIPPLNALRAFEAAARHKSFTKAAAELGVTPTAISHQVKLLEDTIGHSLFRRFPRPLALTAEGQRLFPAIRDSLDSMAEAVQDITAPARQPVLRVSTTVAFASGVLLPHLGDWGRACSDTELQVHASDYPVDLNSGEIDVAVRYARAADEDLVCEELCRDHYVPMLSPALLGESQEKDNREEVLSSLPLIAFSWKRPDPAAPTWERWFEHACREGRPVSCLSKAQVIRLSEETHAIEAAVAGQGVVLASAVIARGHRERKNLVAGTDITLPGLTYFLVYPPRLQGDPRVVSFRRWLGGILEAHPAGGQETRQA